jgi:hypothetical protein
VLALHVESARETRPSSLAAQLVDLVLVGALAQRLADPLALHVASDRQQPGLEARVAAEALGRLDAGREAALDQLFHLRLAAGLVVEEPAKRREVPIEEHAAGSAITTAPAQQELVIARFQAFTIGGQGFR